VSIKMNIELNTIEIENLKDLLESLKKQQVVRVDYATFDNTLNTILVKLSDEEFIDDNPDDNEEYYNYNDDEESIIPSENPKQL
jgi:hypothetical protein